MRPRVSFTSLNIWTRLEACKTVAQAHGWHPNDIINLTSEIEDAFSYEEAMAIIEREFEVSGGSRGHGAITHSRRT
jgi:predicted metallopeptidase